jgi:ABC-type bacteriocin/lantibiotic exporter with double-glycine peptidase domain
MVEVRGINLSGRQKQQIQFGKGCLPRSENVVQECLMKLLYDKTVVYATHQLEFLEGADLNFWLVILNTCLSLMKSLHLFD